MAEVDEARIRDALARVLASEGFVASPTLASFLRYVVEETLAGRGDRLKAYTIAVAALDRPASFDPNDNPLVRVQARRLRNALARYYAGPGRDDAVRIDLPLGGYVAAFPTADAAPAPLADPDGEETEPDAAGEAPPVGVDPAAATPPAVTAPPRRRFGALVALAVAAVVLAVVLALRFAPPVPSPIVPSQTAPSASAPPSLTAIEPEPPSDVAPRGAQASRILPLLLVEVDRRGEATDVDPDLYRRRLEGFALRFDQRVVVTRRSPIFPAAAGQPFYHLRVSVSREGASVNAYFTLQHGHDERILASRAVHLGQTMRAPSEQGPATTTPEDLAVLREMLETTGPIWTDVARLEDVTPALACLTRAELFDVAATEAAWITAADCLDATVQANPELVPALLRLADLAIAEHRRALPSRGGDPLVRAQALIARAAALAPGSAAPRLRQTLLQMARGDAAGAVVSGGRAVEANPHDLAAVGHYGAALAAVGRYADAVPYLWRAVDETPMPPPQIRWFAFLALNNLGRLDEADVQAAALVGTHSPIALTAVLLRAHRRGDRTAVAATLAALDATEPAMRTDPRAALARRGLAPRVVDRLIVDLDAAGLRDGR